MSLEQEREAVKLREEAKRSLEVVEEARARIENAIARAREHEKASTILRGSTKRLAEAPRELVELEPGTCNATKLL